MNINNYEFPEIFFNGKKLKHIDNIDHEIIYESLLNPISTPTEWSINCKLAEIDIEKLNKLLKIPNNIKKQLELKEKLLKKFLMKLIKKEIDRINLSRTLYIFNPYKDNELLVVDKTKLKNTANLFKEIEFKIIKEGEKQNETSL